MTTPTSTYRLQLRAGVTFDAVAEQVDDLAALGVSHLYLSPVLTAASGSTHGYDVVDPTRIDDALGGAAGLSRLVERAHAAGLGLVIDVVPNHLALTAADNPWWWDVLRRGPASDYAAHFDVRWRSRDDGPPQVLVPVLARPLEDELAEGGALRVRHPAPDVEPAAPDAGYQLTYYEHVLPLRDGSLAAAGLDPADPQASLAALNAAPGRLFGLLLDQHYRLDHWRVANQRLNYRRFFDVTHLGGTRVEDPAVFADLHRAVLELVADGHVDGLRIDHPDGMADPVEYLHRLRAAAPTTWIVVEKILGHDEQLRADWPVDGTVGYEFADRVLGLFVDPRGVEIAGEVYAGRTGRTADFAACVEAAKRDVVDELFVAETEQLIDLAREVAAEAGDVLDEAEVAGAVRELLVAFGVYRSYVRPEAASLTDDDRDVIEVAVATARARRPELGDGLDLLREVLLLEQGGGSTAEFVVRFQQLTGPVAAKGVEDTAYYRHLAFVALNEVGGEPAHPGTTPAEFHEANRRRQRTHPTSMLTTSTHDTKRSEDVRARLAVLSEMTDLWVRTVDDWRVLAAAHRGAHGPSVDHELLIYQTLLGAWPLDAERLTAYLIKAAREGKRETHWLAPDAAYEADLEAFVRGLLADGAFVSSLERVVAELLEPGRLTSLSQTLLKLTSPGVPDVYQGSELWHLALVDPDNRRPVDADTRREVLAEARAAPHPVDLLAGMDRGVPKLWVTHRALAVRADQPHAFGPEATYTPLHATGERADHVVAFLRGSLGNDEVLTVAPRLVAGLGGRFAAWTWGDTMLEIPEGRWTCALSGNVVDGGAVPLEQLLAAFPVALLVRETAA